MAIQLILGSCAIALSVMIQAIFVATAVVALARAGRWVNAGVMVFRLVLLVVVLTMWMLAGLSVTIWMWAAILLQLGIFDGLETALYFAIVAFTTLGFGDIILPQNWRLLSGMIAANGMILFGLITAFLIEAISRISHGQAKTRADQMHGSNHTH